MCMSKGVNLFSGIGERPDTAGLRKYWHPCRSTAAVCSSADVAWWSRITAEDPRDPGFGYLLSQIFSSMSEERAVKIRSVSVFKWRIIMRINSMQIHH